MQARKDAQTRAARGSWAGAQAMEGDWQSHVTMSALKPTRRLPMSLALPTARAAWVVTSRKTCWTVGLMARGNFLLATRVWVLWARVMSKANRICSSMLLPATLLESQPRVRIEPVACETMTSGPSTPAASRALTAARPGAQQRVAKRVRRDASHAGRAHRVEEGARGGRGQKGEAVEGEAQRDAGVVGQQRAEAHELRQMPRLKDGRHQAETPSPALDERCGCVAKDGSHP
ncbi:hypothetical protein DPSP01_013790 [Paraphaeosphaeria sporulosa]